jgi:hypothetical protein
MADVHIPKKYRDRGYTIRDFACVIKGEAKYPVATKKTAVNAMSRYNQTATDKCKGGMTKICSAYRTFKLTDTDAFKEHCR